MPPALHSIQDETSVTVAGEVFLSMLPSHDALLDDAQPGRAVHALFAENLDIPGVVVLDQAGQLAGAISRSRFMELQSQPFWGDIHHARPLSSFMARFFAAPLVMPEQERVDVAAERALGRADRLFSEPLVLQKQDGRYVLLESQVLLSALTRVYAAQYRCLQDAQDSLVQAEKMASLGNLVAGMAHEINTPLGVGITAISYLQDRATHFQGVLAAGNVKKAELQNMLAAVVESSQLGLQNLHRAADLVRSFKQVAVDQASEARRLFNLAEVLQEAVTSLKPAIKQAGVTVAISAPAALLVDSYPGALIQVVTNLVMNAIHHAFPEKRAGHVQLSVTDQPENWVAISVEDNGQGIAPENLDRIFEPFFTTRRGRGGTGLGLHIVYNIVRSRLGGRIEVSSAPGQGATFLVTMPASARMSA